MIPITTCDQAKLAAQLIKRFDGIKHSEALDAIATLSGFSSWHAMSAKLPDAPPRGNPSDALVFLSTAGKSRLLIKLSFNERNKPHIIECDPVFEHNVQLVAAHLCFLAGLPPSSSLILIEKILEIVQAERNEGFGEGSGEYCIPLGMAATEKEPLGRSLEFEGVNAYGPKTGEPDSAKLRVALGRYMDCPYAESDVVVPPWTELNPTPDTPSVRLTVPEDPYFVFSAAPIWALNILNALYPPCSDFLPPDYGPNRSIISYTAKKLYRAFSEQCIEPILGHGARLQVADIKDWVKEKEKESFDFSCFALPDVLRTSESKADQKKAGVSRVTPTQRGRSS